jgi:hypothetical protein
LLTWFALERGAPPGSGSGRRRSGYARPIFPYATPDEKGKKVAWAVAWLALVMGAVMILLSVVLPT